MKIVSPSQVLLFVVILFIVFRTVIAYKKNRFSKKFTFSWLLFWLGVLFLVFQQNVTIKFAQLLGIGRGVDLVIYLALIIIFYAIYRIFVTLNMIDRKITLLTRKLALKQAVKK